MLLANLANNFMVFVFVDWRKKHEKTTMKRACARTQISLIRKDAKPSKPWRKSIPGCAKMCQDVLRCPRMCQGGLSPRCRFIKRGGKLSASVPTCLWSIFSMPGRLGCLGIQLWLYPAEIFSQSWHRMTRVSAADEIATYSNNWLLESDSDWCWLRLHSGKVDSMQRDVW